MFDPVHTAWHRVPEINTNHVFQVCAATKWTEALRKLNLTSFSWKPFCIRGLLKILLNLLIIPSLGRASKSWEVTKYPVLSQNKPHRHRQLCYWFTRLGGNSPSPRVKCKLASPLPNNSSAPTKHVLWKIRPTARVAACCCNYRHLFRAIRIDLTVASSLLEWCDVGWFIEPLVWFVVGLICLHTRLSVSLIDSPETGPIPTTGFDSR